MKSSETYFETQSAALDYVLESIIKENRYDILYPNYFWVDHVAYGQTKTYQLELIVKKTGHNARKCLNIILYRMDSGKYELTFYKS